MNTPSASARLAPSGFPSTSATPWANPTTPTSSIRSSPPPWDTLDAESGPVLADYPEEAGPIGLPQASEVTASANGDADKPLDAAGEITALRGYYERWQEQRGRTAVGVTGIPQRRFRGIIRFLEAYAERDDADMDERPADVSVPQFVRYCADDLKAFCYEARMAQRPDASETDIHTWFWGETAVGALIDSITQRLNATGDAKLQATAYGLSR